MRHSLGVENGSWIRLRRRIYAVAVLCLFAPGIWAHAGGKRIPEEIAQLMAEHAIEDALSEREIEVLRGVARGRSHPCSDHRPEAWLHRSMERRRHVQWQAWRSYQCLRKTAPKSYRR
jgi:hypothetical protein